MKPRAYIRMALTVIGNIFLAILSTSIAWNLYGVFNKTTQLVENTNGAVFDGADFSPLFKAGGFICGSIIGFVMFLIQMVVLIILSVVLSLILRALLIREPSVDRLEFRVSAYTVLGAGLISIVVSLILTKGVGLLLILVCNVFWLLFPLLMYIMRLKDLKNDSEMYTNREPQTT